MLWVINNFNICESNFIRHDYTLRCCCKHDCSSSIKYLCLMLKFIARLKGGMLWCESRLKLSVAGCSSPYWNIFLGREDPLPPSPTLITLKLTSSAHKSSMKQRQLNDLVWACGGGTLYKGRSYLLTTWKDSSEVILDKQTQFGSNYPCKQRREVLKGRIKVNHLSKSSPRFWEDPILVACVTAVTPVEASWYSMGSRQELLKQTMPGSVRCSTKDY